MASKDESSEKGGSAKDSGAGGPDKDNPRRHFLMVAMTLGAVFVTAGIASVAKSLFAPSTAPPAPPPAAGKTVTKTVTSTVQGGQSSGASSSSSSATTSTSSTATSSSPFPVIVVANVKDLAVGKPTTFNYPLEETPNLLVKLGVKAQGGVGPDGDIVAFSAVCQHLGCIYGYVPPGTSPACDNTFKSSGPVGYCCCHGTVFDLLNGAKVTDGPSPRPVPQVILSFDAASGDISAIGMGPPTIYGHTTGSDDVLNDLKGGTLVSG
jgi:arsenite oxidase small subunit